MHRYIPVELAEAVLETGVSRTCAPALEGLKRLLQLGYVAPDAA